MIIVTGATGKLGNLVVERLLERTPATTIGLSVRDPEKARSWAQRGLRVRRGDYSEPESLRHAFESADKVLIVSAATTGTVAHAQHRAAIEAARTAGAGRIVYTSHMGANSSSFFEPMVDHAATEDMLGAAGVPFTSLRNGFYTGSAVQLMGPALQTGELVAPEDGPVSWTAHPDLAEAAAIALTDGVALSGVTSPLTATEALDMADVAEIASALAGREIKRIVVSDADYRDGLIGRGVPEQQADLLLSIFTASRGGEFAASDPSLGRLLGRPPMSVSDVLSRHVAG